MGSIIRTNTEGEPSAVLTETGKGGLFSKGYLRDAPAREYVGDGETAVFVLTDGDTGVERDRDGERRTFEPGKGYRAITVVTDRRVIVLVGNAGDAGDKRITLPLVEVTSATAIDGALDLEMTSGVAWRCHAADDGVEDVAAFVEAAADTWRDLEATLDSVKRAIVTATGHRDAGEYEDALEAMRSARDDIEAVQERIAEFGTEWPADAMTERTDGVRDRCLATAAEIRVGYARATIDEGESHWRDGEYELARDAFEKARESYEAVQSLAPRHRTDVDDVERAIERLDRSIERLDEAPLRNAIDADSRAEGIEPSLEALDALAEARERYEDVLELDPDADNRRFAGDRDRIREQREDVTDRFVETALEVGTSALEAGEWYCETGQEDLAAEELERAMAALDRGLPVAKEERPGEADDLRKRRSAAADLLAELEDGPSEDGAADAVGDGTDGEETGRLDSSDPDAPGESAVEGGQTARSSADWGERSEDAPGGERAENAAGESESGENDTRGSEAGEVDLGGSDDSQKTDGSEKGAESENRHRPAREDGTEPGPDGLEGDPELGENGPAADAAAADGGVARRGEWAGLPAVAGNRERPSPAPDDADAGGGADDESAVLAEALRELSPAQFERVVTTVVEATGWRPEPTASTACDYLATNGEDGDGNLAVCSLPNEDGEPIRPETVRQSATLAASVPSVDDVMIATTRPLTDAARAAARSQDVRVLDARALANVLGGRDRGTVESIVPTVGD